MYPIHGPPDVDLMAAHVIDFSGSGERHNDHGERKAEKGTDDDLLPGRKCHTVKNDNRNAHN
jgi:hypothetical protein